MNSNDPEVSQELTKLQTISTNVREIQFRIEERLPHTRQQLLALVCASKWRVSTLSLSASVDMESMRKKLWMEIHSYDYRVREQAELLERSLCELDNIHSNGNTEVKDARKALVVHIQTLLQSADVLKVAASKLMRFTEEIIATMPRPVKEETSTTEKTMDETMEQADGKNESDTEDADEEMESEEQLTEMEEELKGVVEAKCEAKNDSDDETEDADDEMESEESENQTEVDEKMGSEEVQQPQQEQKEEVENEQEEQDAPEEENEPNERTEVASDPSHIDSLPVWTPYYHMERHGDGIYLIAKLHDVHPNNLHVSVQPQSGLITISGVKYPTQKDLILSQWTGTPTYGRFKLFKRVNPELVNVEEATQRQAADGTLVIRLPFYYLHHPRMFERAMYTPRRHCTVW